MSTLEQLKHGLNHAWHNIAEGWQQLSERTVHALTRFNPIHRAEESDSVPVQIERNAPRWGLLAAEMHEDEKNVYVKIEAPGMESKNFDIEVQDNILIVRGEKRVQSEKTEGRYHLMECAYGSFERAMQLPANVSDGEATASYKKGVLTITLPKASHATSNRIDVS